MLLNSKKLALIGFAYLAILLCSCSDNSPKETTATNTVALPTETVASAPTNEQIAAQCRYEIKALNNFNGNTFATVHNELEEFTRLQKFYYSSFTDDTMVMAQLAILQTKFCRVYKSELPAMRSRFVAWADSTLWEYNIDVNFGGNNPNIIIFTSPDFSDRQAIKAFHEKVFDTIKRLRFTHVYYRWYKGDSEPQVFKTNAPKDTECPI